MKKIIMTAIAVMAFTFSNAQETRFGVKGGLNIATIGGADNANALVGFQVGGFAEIKILKKLAIQPELLYSAQGAKMDSSLSSDYTVNLNYINVPVLAKYYITDAFTVEAGPQIGFLVSSKNVYDEKTVDVGFNIGAGYYLTENFSVGIRYTIGLSNIYDYDYDEAEDFGDVLDNTYTNNVLALTAAYKF